MSRYSSFTLVGKSIKKPGSYSGIFPFSSNEDWRKNAVHLRHLDDLVKRVKTLEQELGLLKSETPKRALLKGKD